MKPVMEKDRNSEDICLWGKEKERFEKDYGEGVGQSSKQVRTLFLKREQPLPLPKLPELPAFWAPLQKHRIGAVGREANGGTLHL